MKIKLNLETLIYVVVIGLSLTALALAFLCYLFTDTKVIYQGF